MPYGLRPNGAAISNATAPSAKIRDRPRFPRIIEGRRKTWSVPDLASYRALFRASQQALRSQEDHRYQQKERDGRAVLGREVRGNEVVHDAEQQPAGDGAAHLVEATDDGGDEGDQAERLAVGEFGEVDRADQERGERDQAGVDEESVENHAPDRDAEHARESRVLGGGLHAAAGARAAEEVLQSRH